MQGKAVTTNLVKKVLDASLVDQIDNTEKDCGKCSACLNNIPEAVGTNRSKQTCQMHRCSKIVTIKDGDQSDSNNQSTDDRTHSTTLTYSKEIIQEDVRMIGEPCAENIGRIYYNEAQVDKFVVKLGDYVMLNSTKPEQPNIIAQVRYMWENSCDRMFHAHLFYRGVQTILGENSDSQELFMVDVCDNCPLGSIVCKTTVEQINSPNNWVVTDDLDEGPPRLQDGQTFFFSKHYDIESGRFEDIIEDVDSDTNNPCLSCRYRNRKKKEQIPTIKWNGNVDFLGDTYKIGSGVFLQPGSLTNKTMSGQVENVDSNNGLAGLQKCSKMEIPEPFDIGVIEVIKQYYNNSKCNLTLKIRKFHRPEQILNSEFISNEHDLNLLYWSDDVYEVTFDKVKGKCYLAFRDALEIPAREWIQKGPYRFYFTQAYNCKTNTYFDVPPNINRSGFVEKDQGNGMNNSKRRKKVVYDTPPEWEHIENPLKCLNIFARCFGLSEGLQQAGIAATKWAIVEEPQAAHAYGLNNPDAIIYSDDCSNLLCFAMSDKTPCGKTLPLKGEVEMLIGSPPFQDSLKIDKSPIVSYLSYCDYYRPRYIVLENSVNLGSFKQGVVLKFILRCLLAIGYQVTFGVLQDGNYGVPQTRCRLIIMAAAPGYGLPKFPEPQHVLNKNKPYVSVDNIKYYTGISWSDSAPFRPITIRDAISDLPEIKDAFSPTEILYSNEAFSHFQRMMRQSNPNGVVTDHICQEMAPIIEVLPERSKKRKKTYPSRGVSSSFADKDCTVEDKSPDYSESTQKLDWNGFLSSNVMVPVQKRRPVVHPEQDRVMSVRECARAQGFADHYQLYGNIIQKFRQIDDVVPPPIGVALGREILKSLFNTRQSSRS